MLTDEWDITLNTKEQAALRRVLESAKAGTACDPADRALVDGVVKRAKKRGAA